MKNTFLNFIEKRKTIISENFNSKKIDKALKLIDDVLKKHISNLVPLKGFSKINQGANTYYAKQYIVMGDNPTHASMFQINFLEANNIIDVYSIDFFKDLTVLWKGKAKSDLTFYTLGSSIVYFLPIIWTVVNTKNYNLSANDAKKIAQGKNMQKESYKYYVGALEYNVFENLSDDIIYDSWKISLNNSMFIYDYLLTEELDSNVKDFKDKKKQEYEETKQKWKQITKDIKDIDNAIKGGASTLGELKLAVKHNISVIEDIDDFLEEESKKINKEHEDPDMIFKKMEKYVMMVIKGINPSVILCGAPGVGKTYNVKKQLKENGYVEGKNLCTIKGKCTSRILYLTLMEYKKKGDIVLIDDADGLVGPGAPEDCINILKAGLDSTSDEEGRLINYGVTGKLVDNDGNVVSKKFYYNGGIIVITNYQAGSLDTALRGRSFIQDIQFTVEDSLKRIRDIMPKIDPFNLSPASKMKAYGYLNELANDSAEMEISLRTFTICAKIFETASVDNNFTDDDAKSMIKEQMKLQAQKIRTKRGKY